jgi:hypothetical protein
VIKNSERKRLRAVQFFCILHFKTFISSRINLISTKTVYCILVSMFVCLFVYSHISIRKSRNGKTECKQRHRECSVLLAHTCCGHTGEHGLINFIDTKAKCRHLKKFTCKGTLRQVFIRVYRLEIQCCLLRHGAS